MRNSTLYSNKPVTFRRSSGKILPEKNKKNVGWGTNLQNIEGSLREVYFPDGFNPALTERCLHWLKTSDLSVFTEEELLLLRVFLQTDQAGAEARIVGFDTEPGDYRQLFINEISPHVYVAFKLFAEIWFKKAKEYGSNIPQSAIEELAITKIANLKLHPFWRDLSLLIKSSDRWPLQERYYYFGKQTGLSGNYGIEWHTFQMNTLEKSGGKVVLSREQATDFLQGYRGMFPEIPERCNRIERQVRETSIIYNMMGFPYYITEYNPYDFKPHFAWGPQSTVGEITRRAYTKFYYYAKDNNKKWDELADTHDSFLTQGPLFDVKERAMKMQEYMNQEFESPIDGMKFSMKSATKIGFNWSDMPEHDPKQNPLGLREFKLSMRL